VLPPVTWEEPMTTAAEYRQFAQECIESARAATSEAARKQFLDIAKLWLIAARHALTNFATKQACFDNWPQEQVAPAIERLGSISRRIGITWPGQLVATRKLSKKMTDRASSHDDSRRMHWLRPRVLASSKTERRSQEAARRPLRDVSHLGHTRKADRAPSRTSSRAS
jgi:hypothetical protein